MTLELDTIAVADCREWLASLPDACADSCVTDPPYELGFMGKKWDNTGIAYDPKVWEQVFRVLKPGGYVLAFGGTRTCHRLACAIEDAGFEIRDRIAAWLFGSGFPKAHDVSKAIDERLRPKHDCEDMAMKDFCDFYDKQMADIARGVVGETASTSAEAQQWDGWNTALKPGYEPICMARKSFDGTVADNVLENGTGAINVDDCRISTEEDISNHGRGADSAVSKGIYGDSKAVEQHQTDGQKQGRWPANVVLSHHPDCKQIGTKQIRNASGSTSGKEPSHTGYENTVCYGKYDRQAFLKYADASGQETVEDWECHPDCPIKILDEQSGVLTSGALSEKVQRGNFGQRGIYGLSDGSGKGQAYESTSGGASRFFYCAKTSREERDAGLYENFAEAKVNDGRKKDIDNAYQRGITPRKNTHPTVKPLDLMKWLVRMVTRPDGTVLEPFAGSGSTCVAAAIEGMHFMACDLSAEYVAIAEARVQWARQKALTRDEGVIFAEQTGERLAQQKKLL